MEKMKILLSVLFVLIGFTSAVAQEKAKVLQPNLAKIYQGETKKGLAHGEGEAQGIDSYIGNFKKGYPQGKGTYTWNNGDFYIGNWYKGQRNGEGEYHTKFENRDTIYAGIWKKDKYIGKRTILPMVTYKSSVDRYLFRRIGEGELITIHFKQNGGTNTSITSLIVDGDSGIEVTKDNCICFENFVVPFKCSLRYTTDNKLQETSYEVRFDFEITQMGNWDLVLNN
tara:strand:+ start:10270 stop:10947 length:678 start_codon:yes stop_codon:yes gene_type:complete